MARQRRITTNDAIRDLLKENSKITADEAVALLPEHHPATIRTALARMRNDGIRMPSSAPGQSATEKFAIVKRYGWYIDNAMRQKIDGMKKAVQSAKDSQVKDRERGLSDKDERAKGLQNLIEEVEFMIRDYQQAHDALREIGVD